MSKSNETIIGELLEAKADQETIREILKEKEQEDEILLSVGVAIASIRDKNDFIHVIQQTLKSRIPFADIAITQFDLKKGTFKVLLEDCEQSNLHPDFNSVAFNEYPIADGIHNVIMLSENTVILSVSQLINKGQPHIEFLREAGIKELAGIRLLHNNEVIGTMVLLSVEENSFSAADRQLIKRVSYHFSTAMANILYNEEIRKREIEKEILLNIGSELVSIRSKEDLLPILKKHLEKLAFYNDVTIAKVDNNNQTFSAFLINEDPRRQEHLEYQQVRNANQSFPDGVFEIALRSAKPVLFDLEQLVKQPNVPSYIKFLFENGTIEMVGVSLRDRNTEIGVLFLFSPKRQAFSELQLNLVQGVGNLLGSVVANILANEKIEQQLNEISKYKEKLEEENTYLQKEASSGYNYNDIIGNGLEMQKVFLQLSQVSFANSTVLLLGETGTGKELVARAIHNSSPRKDRLMVKVNCAAMPVTLIESELFGHEKGSFTGAVERRIGKFELANHGTLFLDEVGEMSPDLQVKILRALQEQEIERVGGKTTIKVNVRIIAASNRNLQKEVEAGRFRHDLYYRLCVFPIHLPPLRERKEDIPLLVSHFIDKYSKNTGKIIKNISARAMNELKNYSWPGNVRELEHSIERSILLASGDIIKEVHLPNFKRQDAKPYAEESFLKSHEENEREYIISILNKCNGKVFGPGGAAEILGLNVSTLNSKLKKLGIRKKNLFQYKE